MMSFFTFQQTDCFGQWGEVSEDACTDKYFVNFCGGKYDNNRSHLHRGLAGRAGRPLALPPKAPQGGPTGPQSQVQFLTHVKCCTTAARRGWSLETTAVTSF